jgi:patatin-like phospholipase/acyl hydrolase
MAPGPSGVLPDREVYAWDAAMKTSAAPTFFPVHRGYTDGGIVANNPSILAISKAIAHIPHISTDNCVLLSLGAGTFPRHTNIFSEATREGDVVVGKSGNKKERGCYFHDHCFLRCSA